ncbi:MAG TPA: hypothetical protein VLA96_08725 [Terriglobales bacterium]|nr:hypothetical protein [Terriglobales bacterium]
MPEKNKLDPGLREADNLRFHRRQWRFERAGWIALALFVLLAFLGLFGSGPLSRSQAATPDARMEVEYERFARRQAPAEITFHFSPAPLADGKLRVWVQQDYIEQLGLEHVTPEPERAELRDGKLLYTFAAAEGQDLRVTFELQPQQVGLRRARAGLEGGAELEYWQFIYP